MRNILLCIWGKVVEDRGLVEEEVKLWRREVWLMKKEGFGGERFN